MWRLSTIRNDFAHSLCGLVEHLSAVPFNHFVTYEEKTIASGNAAQAGAQLRHITHTQTRTEIYTHGRTIETTTRPLVSHDPHIMTLTHTTPQTTHLDTHTDTNHIYTEPWTRTLQNTVHMCGGNRVAARCERYFGRRDGILGG